MKKAGMSIVSMCMVTAVQASAWFGLFDDWEIPASAAERSAAERPALGTTVPPVAVDKTGADEVTAAKHLAAPSAAASSTPSYAAATVDEACEALYRQHLHVSADKRLSKKQKRILSDLKRLGRHLRQHDALRLLSGSMSLAELRTRGEAASYAEDH